MSNTKVTVATTGSASSQRPGARSEPVMTWENAAVYHHATAFKIDRTT
ncbi:hypothetical protein ABH995_004006 [Bradyrhizobium yuanmingense]